MTSSSALGFAALVAASFTLFSSSAHAQETATPPPPVVSTAAPPPPAYVPTTSDEPPSDGPPARRGFQIAIRPGVAIPFGTLGKDNNGNSLKQSDEFGGQFATTIDIGGKVIPNLFVGAYLGLNVGGAGGQLSDRCSAASATCTSVSLRIGIEAQYHFVPDGKVNPWLGYGIGWEASSVGITVNNVSQSETASGPEFAHFMGGIDFRLSKVFGLGPFVDFGLGQYNHASVDNGSGTTTGSEITNKALHEWLTVGAKFVFFP